MARTALVVGAGGIVGNATAALLIEQSWTVHADLSRFNRGEPVPDDFLPDVLWARD